MYQSTEDHIKAVWDSMVAADPRKANLPKLGVAHVRRRCSTPPDSILLSYVTPDRIACVHNETTADEIIDQNTDPVTALELSIRAMIAIWGGHCPQFVFSHTFGSTSPWVPKLDAVIDSYYQSKGN